MPMSLSPTDRIRAMIEQMRSAQPAAQAPQMNIEAPDLTPSLPPMDMPTQGQINAPVYNNGPDTFGLGQNTPSFTPPAAPSKNQRIAAAHQKRRQMGQF